MKFERDFLIDSKVKLRTILLAFINMIMDLKTNRFLFYFVDPSEK